MKLLITGVSHKTAPVEVRECLAFREDADGFCVHQLFAREPGLAEHPPESRMEPEGSRNDFLNNSDQPVMTFDVQ